MTETMERLARIREELGDLLPRLRRFGRTLTRNPHDADDLVQVAVLRALSRAEQWREGSGLAGWMFGIMRNAWIDELRSRQRRGRTFVAEEEGEHVGETPHAGQQITMSVQQAMVQLPEEQRLAVMLVLVEGLSYKEAAEALDVPVGTLTSRLARGRTALQALLADDDGGR